MEKKKIGLLSLQWMNNLGTIIQVYALQKAIENRGYLAEYISYKPQRKVNVISPVRQFIKGFPGSIWRIKPYMENRIREHKLEKVKKERALRQESFEAFRQAHIQVSSTLYSDVEQLRADPPEYDIYIVGSDQIWSPNLSYSSEAYMLNFVQDGSKKNSYASSMGTVNVTSEYKDKLICNLKSFNRISCREKSGAEYLTKILERDVAEVLDPTMLLDKNDLLCVSEHKRMLEKEYILCYFLGHRKWHRFIAKELSKKTGMPCYYIAHDSTEVGIENALWDVGPGEFISLINGASYVCTDSFHGSVLSILFQKNLYGFCKRGDSERTSDNSRLYDLYRKFEIEDRLVRKHKFVNAAENIDYSKVNEILRESRLKSRAYLDEILGANQNADNM